ncbi:hypothetical protein ANO11243_065760 [Dothideomycetidae sp. 11243]|nr:hypothetical protein ANO11243_065760 [fungal sp. No.11243]
MSSTGPSASKQPDSRDNGKQDKSAKRKPVRRDPEKRRLQNIQAQKRYREKVKTRINHLESIAAASVIERQGRPRSFASEVSSGADNIVTNIIPSNYYSQPQGLDNAMGQTISHQSGGSSIDFSEIDFSTSAPSTDLGIWDPNISINPSYLVDRRDSPARPYTWYENVDCGCINPHVQLSSVTCPRHYRELTVTNLGSRLNLADPIVNVLRVERLCLIQAVMNNCLHIGITRDMFCDSNSVSPFFRPCGRADQASQGLVTAVQNIFSTVKPDLRPVKEQIAVRHHPVIDILPFPTLRKNLILNGFDVDDEQLYFDLLNGLVFWGGAGISRRDRNINTGNVSTGTPWDYRSWEGRPWFLQKYLALLGGEEGELVRQSVWWRNIRGEDVELAPGT